MKIIQQANSKISKLWNDGKTAQAVYRLFSYIVALPLEGGMLLHNSVTGELIKLDSAEVAQLSKLPCRHEAWMDELIAKHFLVRQELSDKTTVDTLRRALKLSETSKSITGYTILPTTNCNARCFYCYEAGCRHENMSEATADKLLEFMDAHRGGKALHIEWFGGEPLVGVSIIDRICRGLTAKGVPFTSTMISNGYLFDGETARRAHEEWKLKSVQITLDGTEKVYNDTKAYVNPCASPFQRVLDNIEHLMQNGVRVSIRLNVGMHNADDLTELVTLLAQRFSDKTNLGAYTHLLFDNCGTEPVHFSRTELAQLKAKKEALDKYIQSFAQITPMGELPRLKARHCMADNPSSVVVLPSGKLGKCEHYLDERFVGSLDTGITEKQELKCFEERTIFAECEKCPSYPACVKLKLCEPEKDCEDMQEQLSAKQIKTAMLQRYEAWLKGKNDDEEQENEPMC